MGELTIRDVDDDTVERISIRARRHGLSVEQETLTLIRNALDAPAQAASRDRTAAARRIAAMTPKGVAQTDSVILIREARDR